MVRIRKVYDDGRHNAFTTLARWRRRLYVAFRSAESHVTPQAPEGAIRVLASENDGETWTQVALLSQPDCDMRDAKFLATEDRLFLHAFAYYSPQRRDAFVCWTDDGAHFSPFQRAVEEENAVIWWPIYHAGRFYGAGYRYSGDKKRIRTVFYTSGNGIAWTPLSVVHDVPWSNEASLVMEADGTATVLVRNDGRRLDPPASSGRPVLARAKAPYTSWHTMELDQVLQGFALHRLEEGYLIAGRVYDDDGRHTALFLLDGRRLRRLHTLPTGGDTAYPGIVREGRRVLMSYYSSHERSERASVPEPASVYLAELNLDALMANAQEGSS